jgi:hypothetical protein
MSGDPNSMFRSKLESAMKVWEHHERLWQDRGYPVGGLGGCVAIGVRRTARYEAIVREWELTVLQERERIGQRQPKHDIDHFDFGEPAYLYQTESVDINDPERRRLVAIAIARAELSSLNDWSRVPTLSWMMQSDEYLASSVSIEQYSTLYDFRTLKSDHIGMDSADQKVSDKWLEGISMWDPIAISCGMPIPSLTLQMSERHDLDAVRAADRLSIAVLLGDSGDGQYDQRTYTLYRDEVRDRAVRTMMEKMGLILSEQVSDVPRAAYAWREHRVARRPDVSGAATISPP